MKQINLEQIQLVSGGLTYESLLCVCSTVVGGYIGPSLGYIEVLMDFTGDFGATRTTSTYTPNTFILIAGIMLGASIGYTLSNIVLDSYYS